MFQDEVETRQVMAVPMVFMNDDAVRLRPHDAGRNRRQAGRQRGRARSDQTERKSAYDVLIVGGGPAGAAAAVYAARKGIRVGVAAERFGGQTNDTMAHRKLYLRAGNRRPEIRARAGSARAPLRRGHHEPAARRPHRAGATPGGLVEVHMANGGVLQSRSVIVSTGARWRNVNVPGEAGVQEQGRGLLPALRRPAVQGQARGGDRRRQLRRRSGDRPGRHRAARDGDRICRRSSRPTRCWCTS